MKREDLPKIRARRKRVGRGVGSRRGTYAGKGMKGQRARAGARIKAGFEGGQTTLFARLPKRRGAPRQSTPTFPINIAQLERIFSDNAQIDSDSVKKAGLAPKKVRGIKILGTGSVTKAFTVMLPASASAKRKIEAAGGKVVHSSHAGQTN